MNEFPNKWWTKININTLLMKLRDTVTDNRLTGSGRPRSEENGDLVNDLVMSQEDTPQTHRTVREISRETNTRLKYNEISTMSLVAAFYLNTVLYAKMQQIWTFKFLEVVLQYTLGMVGNSSSRSSVNMGEGRKAKKF